jgi:hypothetical protein
VHVASRVALHMYAHKHIDIATKVLLRTIVHIYIETILPVKIGFVGPASVAWNEPGSRHGRRRPGRGPR